MKQTKHVYVTFSEYAPNGIQYVMLNESDREWADKNEDYAYLAEVKIPCVNKSDIASMMNTKIDTKNASLMAQIDANNAKRESADA